MQYNIKITFLKNHHAINIIIAKVTHIAQEYSIIQINNQLRINCATILNANNNQAGEYRGLAQFTSVFAFKRPLKRRRTKRFHLPQIYTAFTGSVMRRLRLSVRPGDTTQPSLSDQKICIGNETVGRSSKLALETRAKAFRFVFYTALKPSS